MAAINLVNSGISSAIPIVSRRKKTAGDSGAISGRDQYSMYRVAFDPFEVTEPEQSVALQVTDVRRKAPRRLIQR